MLQENYAVVFSGGGAFGAWEVGAYEAILSRHQGRTPTIVTGTSAGALNAAGVCAGMAPTALKEIWQGLTPREVYATRLGFVSFLWSFIHRGCSLYKGVQHLLHNQRSLFKTDPLSNLIHKVFAQRFNEFQQSPISCVLTVTNLTHGRREFFFKKGHSLPPSSIPRGENWHEIDSGEKLKTALMGSSAIPILFPSSPNGGYFDGGILLNQPIEPARLLGAHTIYVLIPNPTMLGDADNLMGIGATLMSIWLASSFEAEITRIKDLNLNHMRTGEPEPLVRLCVVRPHMDLAKLFDIGLLSFGKCVNDLFTNGRDSASNRLDRLEHANPSTWDAAPDEDQLAEIIKLPSRAIRISPGVVSQQIVVQAPYRMYCETGTDGTATITFT